MRDIRPILTWRVADGVERCAWTYTGGAEADTTTTTAASQVDLSRVQSTFRRFTERRGLLLDHLPDAWASGSIGEGGKMSYAAARQRLHRHREANGRIVLQMPHCVADRDGYGEPSSKIGCELATRIHPSRSRRPRVFILIAAAFFRQRCAVRNNDLQNALAQLVVLLRERMGKYRRRCVG